MLASAWSIEGRKIGGGDRTRTRYLLLAKQPLSQLSYTPKTGISNWKSLVGLVGLEPTTPALSTQCSNQLSYRPKPVTCKQAPQPKSGYKSLATTFQQPISVSVQIKLQFPERR